MRIQTCSLILPVAFVYLASCNAPAAQKHGVEETLDWVEQSDGSILASSEDEVAVHITRCYPKEAKFDCLSTTATMPGMILLRRELRDDPNIPNGRDIDNFDASQVGYSCNIYLENSEAAVGESVNFYKEAISSEKGMLRKQDINLRPMFTGVRNAPWSAAEVTRFIEENGLKANKLWFDCGKVAEIIDNGSIASLETNLVTYDGVFEGD